MEKEVRSRVRSRDAFQENKCQWNASFTSYCSIKIVKEMYDICFKPTNQCLSEICQYLEIDGDDASLKESCFLPTPIEPPCQQYELICSTPIPNNSPQNNNLLTIYQYLLITFVLITFFLIVNLWRETILAKFNECFETAIGNQNEEEADDDDDDENDENGDGGGNYVTEDQNADGAIEVVADAETRSELLRRHGGIIQELYAQVMANRIRTNRSDIASSMPPPYMPVPTTFKDLNRDVEENVSHPNDDDDNDVDHDNDDEDDDEDDQIVITTNINAMSISQTASTSQSEYAEEIDHKELEQVAVGMCNPTWKDLNVSVGLETDKDNLDSDANKIQDEFSEVEGEMDEDTESKADEGKNQKPSLNLNHLWKRAYPHKSKGEVILERCDDPKSQKKKKNKKMIE